MITISYTFMTYGSLRSKFTSPFQDAAFLSPPCYSSVGNQNMGQFQNSWESTVLNHVMALCNQEQI